MDIRLITVKEDFEKAYNILNQREYPLSFYEYALKHDHFESSDANKLIGVFGDNECIGTLSYRITPCAHLGKILEIREIHQTNIKSYKMMMDFIDTLAANEDCQAIKICKNSAEKLSLSIFDRFENFLKTLMH